MTATATPPEVKPPRPRTRQRRRRRLTTVLLLLVGLVVATLVVVLVGLAGRTIVNSTEGTSVDEGPQQVTATLPSTPGALVSLVADDAVVSTVVLAVGPSGQGGSIVVLPAGTEVFLPGADQPVRLASVTDPLDRTRAAEGLLQVSFAAAGEVGAAELADLLEPYGPFTVDLDEPVVVPGPEGEDTVLAEAGEQQVDAPGMAALLLASSATQSELDRLPRVMTLWQAVAAAARRPGLAPPELQSPPVTVDDFFGAVLAGPAQVLEIPVAPVLDPVRNPEGADLLTPDIAAVRLLMAQVLPGAVSPASGGIRVQLVNPYNDPSLAYEAVGRLVFVGANVVLVSESREPAPTQTIIEHQSTVTADVAALYGPPLGGAVTRAATERIDGIDATIVLGESFWRVLAEQQTATTTMTTETTVVTETTEASE